MKQYLLYLLCLAIFPQCAMDSDYTSKLKKQRMQELQQAIKENSVENFLSCISTHTGKNRLKAFRTAVVQNSYAITHHIPAELKDQLLVLSARHGSRTVAEFLTSLDTYQYSLITDYAFFEALQTQHLKIAKILLDKGASINQRIHHRVCGQITLLHYFILEDFRGSFTIIKWLLEQGADPDLVSSESDIPLLDAEDDLPIVELLCDHGADPNKPDAVGDTALKNFCGGLFLDNEEIKIMIQLLAAGTDINTQNSQGKTALHRAAQTNNIRAALILLHYGASKEIIDNDKKFPSCYIHTNEMCALFSSCTLAPLPKAVQFAQLAIQKKKIKIL